MKHINVSEFQRYERNRSLEQTRQLPRVFRYVVPNILVMTALLWGGGYLLVMSLISLSH